MDNESLIFTSDNTPQVNKYAKAMLTARVLIFIFTAICMLLACGGLLFDGTHPGEKEDAIVLLVFFGGMGLIYLACGIVSLRKPFGSFLIAALLAFLFIMLLLYFYRTEGLQNDVTTATEVALYWTIVILVSVFMFFIVRGAVSARKHKNDMLLRQQL